MWTKCKLLALVHKRTIDFAIAALLLVSLAGCGGGNSNASDNPSGDRSPTTPPEFLFISLPASNAIAAYQIDTQTGALTQVPGSPFAVTGKQPGEIAAHPSGRFLYGLSAPLVLPPSGAGLICAYSIGNNGALNPIDSKSTNGIDPIALSIDPTGKYVYTVAALSIIPDGWTIDGNTGMLTPQSNALTDYQNRFWANGILVFSGFVYESFAGGIVPYKIGANGKLQMVPEAECPPGATCLDGSVVGAMVLGPANKFIFAGQVGKVISLALGADGSLTLAAKPLEIAAGPRAVWGNFLFALGSRSMGSQGLWVFAIDPNTGALTLVQGSPFTVANDGGWLRVDGSGKFVYVVSNDSSGTTSTVTTFSIDSATGALHSTGSPFSLAQPAAGLATTTRGSQ